MATIVNSPFENKFSAAAPRLKRVLIICLVLIFCLFCIFVYSDKITGSIVSFVATQVSGAKVSIREISLNYNQSTLKMKGFVVFNPPGFPKGVLVDLPNIEARYDLAALLKGRPHFFKLNVELKQLVFIKNAQGRSNVDSFKFSKKPANAQPSKRKSIHAEFDLLNLNMGRLVSKDYTQGEHPQVCVYNINKSETYKNVSDLKQLKSIILTAPLQEAGAKGALVCTTAALAGIWALPVAVTVVLVGKDSAQEQIEVPSARLYNRSLELLKRIGAVRKEDSASGVIVAIVKGAHISVKIKDISESKSANIVVSARKTFLPKPEIAAGILYQINEQLK